jgi:hypothetical protein
MKNIFTLLTLLSATSIFAIDRYVDPNLSSGNGTTLFTSITSAVNAAVNGDRIIIASSTFNEAALTISKSLKILPQTAGATINFNANIIIAGFPGMKLEIIGLNLGVYSISSNVITSGSIINRAKISVIDSRFTTIDISDDFYECNIIKNTITQSLNFKYGNVVLNTVNNINFLDESIDNPTNTVGKTLITNNTVTNYVLIYNNNSNFILANNIITGGLYLKRWYAASTVKNIIANNQFQSSTSGSFQLVVSHLNVPMYNLTFTSNIGGFVWLQNFSTSDYYSYSSPSFTSSSSAYGSSASVNILFPSNSESGVFEWSYNGFSLYHVAPTGSQPLSFINIPGTSNIVDAGNPNHDYYDIDLTINDRGINGGPYSQLNYNPTSNPNNSKAFIFDLEMPTDLFPGQNVNIKAKGYHKN